MERFSNSAHLVHCEADGLHIFALFALFSAVFLHQSHQEGAVVLSCRIRDLQVDLELRVDPKCS